MVYWDEEVFTLNRPKLAKMGKSLLLTSSMLLLTTGCFGSSPSHSAQPAQNQTAPATGNSPADSNATLGNSNAPASSSNQVASSGAATQKTYAHPPEMKINTKSGYVATVTTTDGAFDIQLFPDQAPITVNNFVFLANDHFYDHVPFHRIIKSFMIQTGDPTGTGAGGPGYTIQDELPPKVPYAPGIVAMARTSAPNSGGSQFFICTGPDSQSLPPDYVIFGKVIAGMDVVQKIASTPVGMSPGGVDSVPSKPLQKIEIQSISVKETPGG